MAGAAGNQVSTFPLAAKVAVTVTAKLAIPKGHRAGAMSSASQETPAEEDSGERTREQALGMVAVVCAGARVACGGDINSHNILRGGI